MGYTQPRIVECDALHPCQRTDSIPPVVVLCGSTRFIEQFQEHYGRLTDEGKIVLSVGRVVPKHEQQEDRKKALDVLHLRKIDLADEVFVINVNGYIGDSTKNEIAYATSKRKPITYLEPIISQD